MRGCTYLYESKKRSTIFNYLNVQLMTAVRRRFDKTIIQSQIKVLSNVALAQVDRSKNPFTQKGFSYFVQMIFNGKPNLSLKVIEESHWVFRDVRPGQVLNLTLSGFIIDCLSVLPRCLQPLSPTESEVQINLLFIQNGILKLDYSGRRNRSVFCNQPVLT